MNWKSLKQKIFPKSALEKELDKLHDDEEMERRKLVQEIWSKQQNMKSFTNSPAFSKPSRSFSPPGYSITSTRQLCSICKREREITDLQDTQIPVYEEQDSMPYVIPQHTTSEYQSRLMFCKDSEACRDVAEELLTHYNQYTGVQNQSQNYSPF